MFSLPKPVRKYKDRVEKHRKTSDNTDVILKKPQDTSLTLLSKAPSGTSGESRVTLPITYTNNGEIDYAAVVKTGKQVVQTSLVEMRETNLATTALQEPTQDEKDEDIKRTQVALGHIVGHKLSALNRIHKAPDNKMPTFLTYTGGLGVGVKEKTQRLIRIAQADVDPLEPARFKHQKVPRGPESDPVPVLHDAPKKLTLEEQRAWQIPPCVSNWKNSKGFTVSLDKRLAADGRHLIDHSINDGFAKFSEALQVAESEARKEVAERNRIKQLQAAAERKMEEEKLRQLAIEARNQRANVFQSTRKRRSRSRSSQSNGSGYSSDEGIIPRRGRQNDDRATSRSRTKSRSRSHKTRHRSRSRRAIHGNSRSISKHSFKKKYRVKKYRRHRSKRYRREESSSRDSRVDRLRERDQIRIQRRRERERHYKLNKVGAKTRLRLKSDKDRDISERVALGKHVPAQVTGEGLFDQRLFNQDQGMDSGFGNEADYNIYDKPLFSSISKKIYKPKKRDSNELVSAEDQLNSLRTRNKFTDSKQDGERSYKLKPSRDFAGVNREEQDERVGPVQFEKE